MAGADDAAKSTSRIEAALERIARSAARSAPDPAATAEIASRLDGLIGQLRVALQSSDA